MGNEIMGNELISKIRLVQKKIDRSPGYGYLYDDFEELVAMLDSKEETSFSDLEKDQLERLVIKFAKDSIFNNHSSANWMKYSARCFHCADKLSDYLCEERERVVNILNGFFKELVQSSVAPIIQKETLAKYIRLNVCSTDPVQFYDSLMQKTIFGIWRGNTLFADQMSLRLEYTKAARLLIQKYIDDYSDKSVLKRWIPQLDTVKLADVWYNYTESGNYKHSKPWVREYVDDSLDKMLDICLELNSYWYWNMPQEFVETYSTEDLIEILEVTDNDEFKKILSHATGLPFDEKIKEILEHFSQDDEEEIAVFSKNLLKDYK